MYAHRIITLSGPDGYGKRIPPDRLGPLLSEITPTVRRTVRMRFLGRSSRVGRRSAWLAAASDVRFVDYSGNGATVLHFEAPTLGDAAPPTSISVSNSGGFTLTGSATATTSSSSRSCRS